MKKFFAFIPVLIIALVAGSTAVYGYNPVSRVDFAREIMTLYGFPEDSAGSRFTDVSTQDAGVVGGAVAVGFVTGIDTATFAPDQQITLEQAVVMASRAAGLQSVSQNEAREILGSQYNDVSEWAAPYFALELWNSEDLGLHMLYPKQTVNPELGQAILRASYNPNRQVAQAVTPAPGSSLSGKSALDILLAAEERILEADTYRMSGNMTTRQVILMGNEQETVNTDMDMRAQIQAPATIHISSDIRIAEMPDVVMASEILIYDGGLYMRGVGISEDWIRLMEIPEELAYDMLRSNNQLLTTEQLNFLDEQHLTLRGEAVRDGRNAYVIQVTLDRDTAQALMQEAMQAVTEPMTEMVTSMIEEEDLTQEEMDEVFALIQQMLDSMEMSMEYVYFIDTETLLHIGADFTMDLVMEFVFEDMPFRIEALSTGTFNFYGYGEPVDIPSIH